MIATVAWGLLAWALWRVLGHLAAKALAALLVLGMGITSTMATWDFLLLSESLSSCQ
jgi:hypothetical protein